MIKLIYNSLMFEITNRTIREEIQQVQKNSEFQAKISGRTYIKLKKRSIPSSFSVSTPKNITILPKLEALSYSKPKAVPLLLLEKQKEDRYNKFSFKNTGQITSNIFDKKFFRSQKRSSNAATTINISQKSCFSQLDFSVSLNPTTATNIQFNSVKNGIGYQQKYFTVTRKGRRSYNEDRCMCISRSSKLKQNKTRMIGFRNQYDYFAVFDGHGGSACSQFLKENLHNFIACSRQVMTDPITALKQSFEKAQQKFLNLSQQKAQLQTSGSCAVVCLIMKNGIYIANLGDCRALMCNEEQILEMTKDHKPFDKQQKMRIIRCGGKIYKQHDKGVKQLKIFRETRIMPGNLNVSRTLGDIQVKLKKYGGLPGMVSPVPQISFHQKQNYEFLLLASDGLFEAFNAYEIKQLYAKKCHQMKGYSKLQILEIFTQNLANQAQIRSSDNITIVTVLL